MRRLTFEQWIAKVDEILVKRVGLGRDDLPDCCYRDWYDDGVSPSVAAKRAMEDAW